MKVLYIHQYFITPKEPGGTRSYWFSKELIKQDYKVTVITSRSPGLQKEFVKREVIDGINVIYIKNSYSNNMGIIARAISFIKFMLYSIIVALREKDVNLVYATSTPLTIGFPALILKWFKAKKYIFEVRDLWPEVPIQMGGVKNKLIQKILYRFEKIIYNNAEHIIALSPGMFDGVIAQGISKDKVSVIPNMAKIDQFYNRYPNTSLAERFGININNFNVIYFGAMGIANGLEYIINSAKYLNNDKIADIEFIFLGNGRIKKDIISLAQKFKLINVHFIDPQPMNITSEIVNLCDCSIITFLDIPILKTNSPNKLFDSLSAAKPVIVNSSGWTKKMVEKHKCGAFVNPDKPEELVRLLQEWKGNPELLEKLGKNARILAENKYDKTLLTKQFVEIIKRFV